MGQELASLFGAGTATTGAGVAGGAAATGAGGMGASLGTSIGSLASGIANVAASPMGIGGSNMSALGVGGTGLVPQAPMSRVGQVVQVPQYPTMESQVAPAAGPGGWFKNLEQRAASLFDPVTGEPGISNTLPDDSKWKKPAQALEKKAKQPSQDSAPMQVAPAQVSQYTPGPRGKGGLHDDIAQAILARIFGNG